MATRVTVFTDLFTRANETPLAGNWDQHESGAPSDINLVSNRVQASVGGSARVSVNSITFDSDQWAELELDNVTVQSSGEFEFLQAFVYVRSGPPNENTDNDGYGGHANPGHLTSKTAISRFDEGVGSTLLSDENATTWASGDLLALEVEGAQLRLFRNGSQLLSANDATHVSGRVGLGIGIWGSNDPAVVLDLDNFAAGNFVNVSQWLPVTITHGRQRPFELREL